MSIVSQLEKIGITPEAINTIESDINNIDARSLLSEVLINGLWRCVVDETD